MMIDLILAVSCHVFEPLTYLFDGSKRIFWLYLLSSACIYALAIVLARDSDTKLSLKGIWRRELWFNRSSWVDVQWISANQLFRTLLVLPLISGQIGFAMMINRELYSAFGEGNMLEFSHAITTVFFTASLFMIEDFSRFLLHFAYHKIPILWRFHAIHHSATTLTPITLYRIHTFEMMINTLRSLVVTGTLSGVFIYCFAGAITQAEIFGASIFNVVFNMAGSNLRHSPVWIGFGRFETVFISPAQHQIHHSSAKIHHDKNFGSSLAIWDKLFGTWMESKKQTVSAFGVHNTKPSSFSRQIFGIKLR